MIKQFTANEIKTVETLNGKLEKTKSGANDARFKIAESDIGS